MSVHQSMKVRNVTVLVYNMLIIFFYYYLNYLKLINGILLSLYWEL
jgi:hypothetical protein